MRLVVAIIAAIVLAAAAYAWRDAPRPSNAAASATPTPTARATADPANELRLGPAPLRPRETDEESAALRRPRAIAGLRLPIDDVGIPDDTALLPDAPREYRGGWHEGIDFPAPVGTPVHAVAAGVVARVDRDFVDWDEDTRAAALAEAAALGYTPERTLDLIRGRQVWIDHGGGVMSRYAHLDAVADLAVGQRLAQGAVVGLVGSSGYPEGGPHLHLEVRLGTSYLGEGLTGDALVAAVARAFR